MRPALRPGGRIVALAAGVARAIPMTVLALVAASASAGTPNVGGTIYIRPAWPVYLPGYPGACLTYGYGTCAVVPWGDLRPWVRPVAPNPPDAIDPNIWGSTGSPWGYVRRLPPPTSPSQIQPRYQDASTIRPEFGGP
jgi:hypothetical protein